MIVEFRMPVPAKGQLIGELEVTADVKPVEDKAFGFDILDVEEKQAIWGGVDVLPLLQNLEGSDDIFYHIRSAARNQYIFQLDQSADPVIIGEGAESEEELHG